MQYSDYSAIKVSRSIPNEFQDTIVIEAPLQIDINSEPYTVVMRTPGNDLDLIRGLLYAEDIYKAKSILQHRIIKNELFSTIIDHHIPKELLGKGYLNKRTLLSVSSCGICGKKELSDIEISGNSLKNNHTVSQQDIHRMVSLMQENQVTFRETGGSHACALFNKKYELLTIKEDIGRHNAVDKCVGNLLNCNALEAAHTMLVSGRVSYEIVSKAFFAKIPIIVAVSACSTLAIDFAKEFGICLIGFNRDHNMTIYANTQYISYERA